MRYYIWGNRDGGSRREFLTSLVAAGAGALLPAKGLFAQGTSVKTGVQAGGWYAGPSLARRRKTAISPRVMLELGQ